MRCLILIGDQLRPMIGPGFAWEYVRRNPAYQRDCRELAHSEPDSPVINSFRRRWGLCFCD